MPDTAPKFKEYPLTYEKGLVTEIEESVLELGQLSELENWEPTAQGGLRVRNTWDAITKTGLPTTYKVRGFGTIATGASSSAPAAPTIVQTSKWPDGDADPVVTKTGTLNGCTIGNILVAVVSDDSDLAPTTTVGWTQRAIGSGEEQRVKFYTKIAAASTEAFTYTITQARIRSLTVYEVANMDSEDPGIKWGAAFHNAGVGGTDSISVTATDTDGGIAIIGYTYDGGTPATSDSGTAGMPATTLDNANTRLTLTYEDLDQLDGFDNNNPAGAGSYVTPSWTPPSSGIVFIVVMGNYLSGGTGLTVSGNGLTWNESAIASDITLSSWRAYAWADCSLVTPTTGAITVTTDWNVYTMFCSFVLLKGADASSLYISDQGFDLSASPQGPNVTPEPGSVVIGGALQLFSNNVAPVIGSSSDSFTAQLDHLTLTNAWAGGNGFHSFKTAISQNNPGSGAWSPDWTWSANAPFAWAIQLRGDGNAAQSRHGVFTTNGSVIEDFAYIANKPITMKMVVWGYTPPAVSDDSVQFFITMALAVSATEYEIYRVLRDEITSGTWVKIDEVTDALSTDSWVAFAQGAGKLVWSSSTLTQPRVITLNPLGAENVTDMLSRAGRCVAYHKDRMFIAGSSDNPSRLYFSDIGVPTDFTTLTDFLDIGGDDGEAIQDIISVEGLLLVCKTNRLYLVSGSGIESFFVNELPGGSAASGRCVVRTPYGTIVAGVDDIWVVQGGAVDPMSRPLGAGYRITGNVSCAYAQDSALIADSGSGSVWRANLVTGAWMLEPTAITATPNPVYNVFSLNGRLYYGTNDSTTQVGGTRQLSSGRDYDETTGGLVLRASTGRMSMLGPSYKYTPRNLFLQLRSHDPDLPNEILVTIESNLGSEEVSYRVIESTQRERRGLGRHKGAEWLKVSFFAASSASHAAIDIEKSVIGMLTEEFR